MLLLDTENIITFRLALTGTVSPPSVRILLYLPTTLVFDASPEPDGRWSVNIRIPNETVPGSYKMAVEVTVGGRIFVPLKSDIQIKRVEFEIEDMEFTPKRKPKYEEPKYEESVQEVKRPAPKNVGDLLKKALKEQSPKSAPTPNAVPLIVPSVEPKVVPAPTQSTPAPIIKPTPAPEAVHIPADVPKGPSVAEMLLKALKEQPMATPKVVVQVPISELIHKNQQEPEKPKSSALGDLLLSSLKEYAENPPEPVEIPLVRRRAQISVEDERAPAQPQVSDLLLRIFKEKNDGVSIEAGTSAIAEAIVKNVPDSSERNRLLELAGIQVQHV